MAALSLLQCADDDTAPRYRGGDRVPGNPPSVPKTCAVPSTGCPCTQEGKEVDCGVEAGRKGDNVSCAMGRRTCENATWSACQTTGTTTTKYAPLGAQAGLRTLGLDVGDEFDQTALQLVPSVSQLTVNSVVAFNGASSPCTPNQPQAALLKDFNDGTGTWVFNVPGSGGGTYVYPTNNLTQNFSGNNWRITGNISTYSGFGMYAFPCAWTDLHAFDGIEFDIRGNAGPSNSLNFGMRIPVNSVAGDGGTCTSGCLNPQRTIPVTTTNTTLRIPFSSIIGGTPLAHSGLSSGALGLPWFSFNWSSGSYAADITIDNIRFYGGVGLAPAAVPCMDPCDPYCNVYIDTPSGVDVGSDLTVTPSGISLVEPESGTGSCSDIVILPSSPVVTVTALDNVATTPAYEFVSTPSTITFTATCGAGGPQIFPSWVLTDYDSATIDQNGVFRVYSGVAQNINVQALTSLGSQTTAVQVKVDISTVDPACTSTALFSAAPTGGADPATILYPYSIPARPVTFPLSLSAPLVQWSTGGTNAGCVKVTLRYPVGGPYTFSWSRIANGEPKQGTLDTAQPALQLDQTVWNVFDRTAAGSVGEIVLQRKQALAAAVMTEKVARVGFATDALRGTVYYTQYYRHFRDAANTATDLCAASGQPDLNFATYPAVSIATGQRTAAPVCPAGSCVGNSIEGGTTVQALRVGTPGAVAVNAFGAEPGCPVCHSVSADGRFLVTGSRFWNQVAFAGTTNGVNTINADTQLTPVTDAPAYSYSYDGNSISPNYVSKWDLEPWRYGGSPPEDSRGFAYAAISPDGHYVLQGPQFWGSGRNDIAANNTQDGVDPAGGKRYALIDREKLRPEVQVATAAALTLFSATASTLTGTASTLTIDGYAVVVGDSVLVKNQATTSQNGIYTRIANDGSARWRLLRRTDADAAGELSFGQKFEVRNGTDNGGKYLIVATPTSGAITPGTTNLGFALYTTVRVATTAALPNTPAYSTAVPAAHTLSPAVNAAFPTVDGVVPTVGLGILVKNQVTTGHNGIYTLTAVGSGVARWVLTRRIDSNLAGDFNPGLRVRVTEGTTNGGRVYELAAAVATLGTTAQTYTEDTTLLNEGRTYTANAALPNMMVPVFSPNGAKLAYINADADPIAAVSTGWRRGLTVMDFDAATARFSNKQRLVNTWNSGSAGVTMKWPFFESDSQSLLYVESEATEYCSPTGIVGNVDTDLERACFDNSYGNMGPTLRGYWKGTIKAVNINSPATTVRELSYLNDTVPFASAQDRAYQPTVLPTAVGGKRWVIFTSPRTYGNQLNQGGTHFTCNTPLLWMAAIDDSPAAASDRSYPAFLLPGQRLRSITDTVDSSHYMNERGYLVPSPCTPVGTTCTVNEECCGGSGMTPTTACRIDLPVASPPTRRCATLPALCGGDGDTCATAADCCEVGALCVAGACSVVVPPGDFSPGEFARTFEATCPAGYHVVWGNFEWRATVPTTSTITFTGQSAASTAGLASATVVALTQATNANSNPPPAAANEFNVGAALREAGISSFGSASTLRITIHLEPSVDLSAGPTLHNWAQRYECQAME